MLIHTLEYHCIIKSLEDHRVFIEENWRPKFFNKQTSGSVYKKDTKYCTYEYNIKYHRLQIKYINPTKLLGRDITADDVELFKVRFLEHFNSTFKHTNPFQKLTQVHYYEDFYIESDKKFNLYIQLIRKSGKEVRKGKKIKVYATSIHSRKSTIQINIYDKFKEAETNNIENSYKYKNVIRFEVQLRRKHIAYMKKRNQVPDTIEEYWSNEKKNEYLNRMLKGLIFNGDYYTIDKAKTILKHNYNQEQDVIKPLIDILINISKYGFDIAKSNYSQNPRMFNQYIKLIQDVGINPILIPKNHKSKIRFLNRLFTFDDINLSKNVRYDWKEDIVNKYNDYPNILGIKEMREILDVGRTTAYKLISSGNIKGLKRGNVIKVHKKDILNYLFKKEEKATICNCILETRHNFIINKNRKNKERRICS